MNNETTAVDMRKKRLAIVACSAILALVMALGGFFLVRSFAGTPDTGAGLSADVNEEGVPYLDIVLNNVDLGERFRIAYAVNPNLPSGSSAEDIKMAFWTSPQDSYLADGAEYVKSVWQIGTVGSGATAYEDVPLFRSAEIDATDLMKPVYARAFVEIDGTNYYSEVCKYSVLQYIALRQEATSGVTDQQRKLYEKILEYGDAAQIALGHDKDRLCSDYVKIETEGGTLPDGFRIGMYYPGDELTLTADSFIVFEGWYDSEMNLISTEPTVTVTVGEAQTYAARGSRVIDFEDSEIGDTLSEGENIINEVKVNVSAVSGNSLQIAEDPVYGSNNVLKIVKTTEGVAALTVSAIGEGTNAFVFEADVLVGGRSDLATDTATMNIILGEAYALQLHSIGDNIVLYDINSVGGRNYLGASAKADEWIKLRVEYYTENSTAKIYVNNTPVAISGNFYAYDGSADSVASNVCNSIYLQPLSSVKVDICLDNVFLEKTADTYSDTDKTADTRTVEPTTASVTEADKWVVTSYTFGEEGAAALRSFDETLYGDELIEWVAGLYDPEVGAFYYAYSGKDTEGYLPDLEATSQALGFLSGSGALSGYGNNVKNALPEEMLDKIYSFALGTLASDGYFRHPQWTHMTIGAARLGRDLGYGINFLKNYGSDSHYDETINGMNEGKGSATSAVSYMMSGNPYVTAALASTYSASSVVAVASTDVTDIKTAVESEENFLKWMAYRTGTAYTLGSSDGDGNGFTDFTVDATATLVQAGNNGGAATTGYKQSHGFGHNIASVSTQIKSAGYGDLCIEYLNKLQDCFAEYAADNASASDGITEGEIYVTGLWELPFGENDYDDSAVRYYTELSGLFKLGSVYSTMGASLRNTKIYSNDDAETLGLHEGFQENANGETLHYGYIDAMIDQCIKGILHTAEPIQIVHVYNPWKALESVLSNIKKQNALADDDPNKTYYDIDRIYEYVRSQIGALLSATATKASHYKTPDGGFSYMIGYSDAATQSSPVGLGLWEGDMNATCLMSNGMRQGIYNCLGITKVNLYTADRYESLIEDLGNNVTEAKKPAKYTFDFTNNNNMQLFDGIVDTEDVKFADEMMTFTDGSTSDNLGFSVMHRMNKGSGSVVDFDSISYAAFESDFCIDWDYDTVEATENSGLQIKVGGTPLFMLFISKSSDGNVNIYLDTTTNSGGQSDVIATVSADTWFKLRVEYRVTDGAAVFTVTVTEEDGIANTYTGYGTYYYGYTADSTPPTSISNEVAFNVLSMDGSVGTFNMDNISVEFATSPKICVNGGEASKTEGLVYGEEITLTAPETNSDGAPFLCWKRTMGIAQNTLDDILGDYTYAYYEDWHSSLGTVIGSTPELTVAAPAGSTTFTAVYDTATEVTLGEGVNTSDMATDGNKYNDTIEVYASIYKDGGNQIFSHYEVTGTDAGGNQLETVRYSSAHATITLLQRAKITVTAVYTAVETEDSDFTVAGGTVTTVDGHTVTDAENGMLAIDSTGNDAKKSASSLYTTTVADSATNAVRKVFEFTMMIPEQGNGAWSDYYNEVGFDSLYQMHIQLNKGGADIKELAMLQVKTLNSMSSGEGNMLGYTLNLADNPSVASEDTFANTVLSFGVEYRITLELVFMPDSDGALRPHEINFFVDGEYMGTSSIFFVGKSDGVVTYEAVDVYPDYATASVEFRIAAMMRNKALLYLDKFRYMEFI